MPKRRAAPRAPAGWLWKTKSSSEETLLCASVDYSFWVAPAAPAADNGALRDQLVRIRDKAGIGEDIGALRVFDVIAWMHQGRQGQVATS
ncbi:DUF6308 family protein [Streptomyces sp. NPDC050149]|uniref:DUF6308 family protein n=1 Tax=Streptomyces sp. NPDC050149 TaxID=3365603 RepID=UPI0037B1F491